MSSAWSTGSWAKDRRWPRPWRWRSSWSPTGPWRWRRRRRSRRRPWTGRPMSPGHGRSRSWPRSTRQKTRVRARGPSPKRGRRPGPAASRNKEENSMRDAVIVQAIRTPVGRRRGALSGIHPADLSAVVLNALVEGVGLDAAMVDDVVWGCVGQVGEQGVNIARNAILAAGWPESVPGTTVDRQCGSSQQAVHFAAQGVMAGAYDIAIAAGVESMTRTPMGSSVVRELGYP